jgi:hypothetical protein
LPADAAGQLEASMAARRLPPGTTFGEVEISRPGDRAGLVCVV